jgi:predicted DNA binding CopG/RHH family protein
MKRRAKKALKPIPTFRSDEEAGEFWMTHDTTEYGDWTKARRVAFPNLRPSTATISLRLPQGLLNDLRILANERDIPYQSLLKVYLAERVAKERRAPRTRGRRRASALVKR